MALTVSELVSKLQEVGKPNAVVVLANLGVKGEIETEFVDCIIDGVEEGDDPGEVWLTGEVTNT